MTKKALSHGLQSNMEIFTYVFIILKLHATSFMAMCLLKSHQAYFYAKQIETIQMLGAV